MKNFKEFLNEAKYGNQIQESDLPIDIIKQLNKATPKLSLSSAKRIEVNDRGYYFFHFPMALSLDQLNSMNKGKYNVVVQMSDIRGCTAIMFSPV